MRPLAEVVREATIPDLSFVTPADVLGVAAVAFRTPVEDLAGPVCEVPLVHYRQAAMAVCRLVTPCSLPVIGRAFNGRDHTTVAHAVRRVDADPKLSALAERLALAVLDVHHERTGGGL